MAAVRASGHAQRRAGAMRVRGSLGSRCRCATVRRLVWCRGPRPRRRSPRGRPCCRAAPGAPPSAPAVYPWPMLAMSISSSGLRLRTWLASISSSLSRPTIARAASMAAGGGTAGVVAVEAPRAHERPNRRIEAAVARRMNRLGDARTGRRARPAARSDRYVRAALNRSSVESGR